MWNKQVDPLMRNGTETRELETNTKINRSLPEWQVQQLGDSHLTLKSGKSEKDSEHGTSHEESCQIFYD